MLRAFVCVCLYACFCCNEGCDILVYPGAFNMTTGPAHWTLLQRARAVDSQAYVVAVSPARTTSTDPKEYVAWGHSSVISPWGEVMVEARQKNTSNLLTQNVLEDTDGMLRPFPLTGFGAPHQ